jgi:6-phosphogluconolactonase
MICVYSDLEALSRAAAELFAQRAARAASEGGRFSVALAGGNTPRRTYELLAEPPFRDRVPWQKAHVFWGDERCVPADDPRSNAGMARQALLDRVPIPPVQIHPIDCTQLPADAAARYEDLLHQFFGPSPRFDLILLGLGENGHTASLFPAAPALREYERWVAEVRVADQDPDRVTFTPPLINQAAMIAFLVSGAAKAQVLRKVLTDPAHATRLPAQLIHPTGGELRWLVDQQAGRLLESRPNTCGKGPAHG